MGDGVPVLTALKLPFVFAPEGFVADLAAVTPEDWSPHYNDRDFGGQWAGASLRSRTGRADDLGVTGSSFLDTPLLSLCPAFREALQAFECPLKAVRLLSLAPGSFIREHCDNALDFEDGEVRVHIPLQTNDLVGFYLSGERLRLEIGQSYYINVNLPHRVSNRGTADRVHLVIDAEVNDWLRDVFARGIDVARIAAPDFGIDRFRKMAAGREDLLAIRDRRDLLAAAVKDAAALGFSFHEADLEAASALPSKEAPDDLTGWIPVSLEFGDGAAPLAEWLYAPGERFTEPFFEDSVRGFRRTPLTVLTRCKAPLPGAPGAPVGMIFHMSRCGSTLVSRAFAALPCATVLSEPQPFDQILQCGASNGEKIQWLRWLAGAFAGDRLIVKFDAWHAPYLPLIQEAFPESPWVFVSRNPLEVLASQLRQPGLHMIPPPENRLGRVEFAVGVLSEILRAARDARAVPNGLFVDYSELPDAITGKIAGHFGMTPCAADLAMMRAACEWDAKNPHTSFRSDQEAKRAVAREFEDNPAVLVLLSLYEELRRDCGLSGRL
jgi:hypothetical protein